MSLYAKVYHEADGPPEEHPHHIPFHVRWAHDQLWMSEIKVLGQLQEEDARPHLTLVPKPEVVGRVRVDWFAIAYGTAAAFYLAGLLWFVSWLVPELAEFTR